MPTFTYEAREQTGKVERGTREGESAEAVARELRRAPKPVDVVICCGALTCLAVMLALCLLSGPSAITWIVPLWLLGDCLSLAAFISLGWTVLANRRSRKPFRLRLMFLVVLLMAQALIIGGRAVDNLMHVGLRRNVTARTGLPELQAAAMKLLGDQPKGSSYRKFTSEELRLPGLVPEAIRKLQPSYVSVAPEGHVVTVMLGGGGFFAWGMFVGSPEFRKRENDPESRKWQPGIYGWIGW